MEINELKKEIENYDENKYKNVDLNSSWAKRYPILKEYKKDVNENYYKQEINKLLDKLIKDYKYNERDALLVLKDILATVYYERK